MELTADKRKCGNPQEDFHDMSMRFLIQTRFFISTRSTALLESREDAAGAAEAAGAARARLPGRWTSRSAQRRADAAGTYL